MRIVQGLSQHTLGYTNVFVKYYTILLKQNHSFRKKRPSTKDDLDFLLTIIINVLRTTKPYKIRVFKSFCRLLVTLPKRFKTTVNYYIRTFKFYSI